VEQVVAFRRRHFNNLSLISDHWDDRSTHHAVLRDDEIVSAARLTQKGDFGLPFMDYVILGLMVFCDAVLPHNGAIAS
jgi:hypothetical protein